MKIIILTINPYKDKDAVVTAISEEETITFLDKECSEEQFIWMSEIFDEIAERTKSK